MTTSTRSRQRVRSSRYAGAVGRHRSFSDRELLNTQKLDVETHRSVQFNAVWRFRGNDTWILWTQLKFCDWRAEYPIDDRALVNPNPAPHAGLRKGGRSIASLDAASEQILTFPHGDRAVLQSWREANDSTLSELDAKGGRTHQAANRFPRESPGLPVLLGKLLRLSAIDSRQAFSLAGTKSTNPTVAC